MVLYDEQSKQLSLRNVKVHECPVCHRPFQGDPAGSERSEAPSATYMNPSYFSMLRRSLPGTPTSSRPSSPRRRLAAASVEDEEPTLQPPAGAEFVASEPWVQSKGISSSSFSPNYFKTFFREERELGRGGRGVVLLVTHVLDRCSLGQFACKRVPVGNNHDWLEKVLVEVQTLQHLSHANLVSYKHVWLEDFKINKFGPSVPCAFILQQYCNAETCITTFSKPRPLHRQHPTNSKTGYGGAQSRVSTGRTTRQDPGAYRLMTSSLFSAT